MNPSVLEKLIIFIERYEEISGLLSSPEIMQDQNRFMALSKEYAELGPIVEHFKLYQEVLDHIENAENLLKDQDPEIRSLATDELKELETKKKNIYNKLQFLLLPKDPNDDCNIFLEIRAGTGGDEAAIFSGDLCRMYTRYAEYKKWKIELISESLGDHGGYKEIILRIIGKGVYSHLKFESGAHRVQRVPVTESQGRIHTSACTVAVMPEVEKIEAIDIDPSEVRIDTYRASGAGGQHVNRTDSAVRITHIATGVVAECQDERSQHKNKAKAYVLLKAKLLAAEQEKQQTQQSETRKSLIGSGDRSERIRTYNFPQGRLTDHRINFTIYKLPQVIDGDLTCVIEPLMQEHHTELLAKLAE